jgi:hypothetical protein
MAELQGSSVESHMQEIEAAARNTEARARLDKIRAELGMAPGSAVEAPNPPA